MSLENLRRRTSDVQLRRSNGTETRSTPALVSEEAVRGNRRSGENNVLQAELEYKNGRIVGGFVLRQFKDADIVGPEIVKLRIDDTLRQWARIREVNQSLNKDGVGFNIPGTIRGISIGEASGILMSDLTEDGKYEAIDLKMLRMHPEKVSPEQWEEIKTSVLRDLDLATNNGIKIVGGNAGLDAWLTIRDPITNTYRVFLVDIGPYTSIEHHPLADVDPQQKDLRALREKAVASLQKLETDLQMGWSARGGRLP